jgi:TIR domain/Protein of unknown function (DUF1566)
LSHIFVSYSQSDRAKARMLADALQREGWSVWWDPKIPPGRTFDEVIDQALERAKCVIVLWSKTSVTSGWVKAEAAEGKSRGILIPAKIQDDVKIPLEFRYLHASRLTDWEGQSDHTEFGALKAAVAELLGDAATSKTAKKDSEPKKTAPASEQAVQTEVPQGVYLDPETGLMWTMEDNGSDINCPQAIEYARQLRLGGYSDWRLPTIDELEKLYDPRGGSKYNIRKPFRLTEGFMWSSTKEGSDFAWGFLFDFGKRYSSHMDSYDYSRALCVRRSGE